MYKYTKIWRRGDLNSRPLAYGASELPGCSTSQYKSGGTEINNDTTTKSTAQAMQEKRKEKHEN